MLISEGLQPEKKILVSNGLLMLNELWEKGDFSVRYFLLTFLNISVSFFHTVASSHLLAFFYAKGDAQGCVSQCHTDCGQVAAAAGWYNYTTNDFKIFLAVC